MKRLRSNSVIVRFAGIMLLALVLPVAIVLLLTANRLSAMERENAHQFLGSNLRTVSSTVDQVLRNLEFSHVAVFQDRHFLSGTRLLAPYNDREEYSDYRNNAGIRNCISRVAVTNNYIDSIYVYSFTAERFFSSRVNWDPEFNRFSGVGVDWLEMYHLSNPSHPWHITKAVEGDRTILSSYREIWVYGNDLPIGLLSVNIDALDITRMLTEVAPSGLRTSLVVDTNGRVISPQNDETGMLEEIITHIPVSESEGYFEFRFDGEDIFASFYTSPYSGFKYVIATPLNQIQTSAPVMIQLIVIFLLLLVLLVILAMLLARHYFHIPITSLFSAMKRLQSGDFTTQLPKNPTYEFDYINSNFNNTVESIRNLINENYASQLINKEAQLRNLQNQINEHFLYNTLDSIHWLAKMENASKACDMVFALANFYRLSLSFGQDVIPVRDVIKMLENYLYIQKFRMRDALSYSITCDPSLLEEQILKNVLQPLVENAIIHGITGLTRPGNIEISFSRFDLWMRITVEDNGKGFTEEKLKDVLKQLDLQDPYCEHSFALKAIQSQLQIFYGIDIRLNIDTVFEQGTKVWLDLPVASIGGDDGDGLTENDNS